MKRKSKQVLTYQSKSLIFLLDGDVVQGTRLDLDYVAIVALKVDATKPRDLSRLFRNYNSQQWTDARKKLYASSTQLLSV